MTTKPKSDPVADAQALLEAREAKVEEIRAEISELDAVDQEAGELQPWRLPKQAPMRPRDCRSSAERSASD